MNMFKSFGTLAACAALLSSGLSAQDTDITVPKSNSPIVAKAQDGEVLGSLSRTVDKWIPNVNINAGFQSKFFNRGLMLDTNAHASIDVNLSWRPTENSRLSIGINGSVPTRNSHKSISQNKTIQGKQIIDENGRPVSFAYFDNSLGYFGERWNQNVLLDQGLYNEKTYSPIFEKSVPLYTADSISEKISYTDLREKNEFDERQIKLEYTYTFKDISVFGDVSVSGGVTLLRDNDIYSKVEGTLDYGDYSLVEVDKAYVLEKEIEQKLSEKYYNELTQTINEIRNDIYDYVIDYEAGTISYIYFKDVFKAIGEEKYPASQYPGLTSAASEYMGALIYLQDLYKQLGDLDPDGAKFFADMEKLINDWKKTAENLVKARDYRIRRIYSVKRHEQRRQELNLGLSLDNVLNSNTMVLNPNMSFNFDTTGHVWMQYGLAFSMPLDIISEKLTWDTSLDSYWFDHDYFKISECSSYYVVNQDGKINPEKTAELQKIKTSFANSKTVSHSTSGFKTLTARTALNYAIHPNITISPNISAVHRFDILDKKAQNDRFFGDNDFVWCGINLNISF